MNIKILSDSTCDLPLEVLEKYNITMIPLTVIKDGIEFTDGVDITPADIFNHVANGGSLCSTSANNIGEYAERFAQYASDYDGIIQINISSEFSSCYQNACLAAEEFDNVRVIDSMNLSTGQGHVVLKACELAKEYDSLDALQSVLQEYATRVEASFVLDRLDYMVKGGRCSAAAALGANLLNLKPCIEVKDGKMTVVKKYRGNYARCLTNYVKDRLCDRTDIDNGLLFLTYTPVSNECLDAVKESIRQYGHFHTVLETTAGCTVSCHCGPGTLGILFVRK